MKNNNFNLDKKFADLIQDNALDINTIEDLALNSINEYKQYVHQHIEELLQTMVDEHKLIVKKNKNGKIVDIISVTNRIYLNDWKDYNISNCITNSW